MRNNSVQCAEDEREIKYFDFRTFGAAAPRLRPPRRAPEAIIGRACDVTHWSEGYAHNARAPRKAEVKLSVKSYPALYVRRVCTIYRGLFKYYIYYVYLIQK